MVDVRREVRTKLTPKCGERFEKLEDIIKRGNNSRNIAQVSEILGVDYHIAERYFNRTCSCGKVLGHYEVGMFMKYTGRYAEKKVDDREYLCMECLSKRLNVPLETLITQCVGNIRGTCNLF